VLLIPLLLVSFCVGSPAYYDAKYENIVGLPQPTALPAPVRPEKQTEPHTCGLHSLSSLHRAYGLDPERYHLRFRLGVDKPFTNLIPSSRGTIHPDMTRVLKQDGFDTEIVNPDASDALSRVTSHLKAGHLAVALIKVNSFHWIVMGGLAGDNVVICDSLREVKYEEPLDAYMKDRVYSVLLVKPTKP